MIFPDTAPPAAALPRREEGLGDTLAFDYALGRFPLVDGGPERQSGAAAVRQWLELLVRTIPGRYDVYGGTGFGVDTRRLVGKKSVPAGALLSELRREIEEGARLCPAIRSVYGFGLEGDTISFTAVLNQGGEEAVRLGL